MIDKKQMTEEEIKLNYITPAIEATWDRYSIRMEFPVTLGRIIIDGRKTYRKKRGEADYLLFHNNSGEWFPLAVVEAKDNNHSVLGGMGQAKKYARAMKVPFAFSSNGDYFAMYDFLTGTETDVEDYIPMDKFPSPQELWRKYRLENNNFTDEAEKMLSIPYFYREGMNEPRYYQWIAVNKVLEAIANGKRRALIVLATGTGKTLVAFHIIWRLLEAEAVKRVLFLAHRDVLISQPMLGDFAPFGKRMHRLNNHVMDTTHEIYLSLYHQMKNGVENYYTAYDRDFFDLVIVDECHYGSADEESSWHEILEYFNSTIQIGMTATPKETEETSNIDYFGDGEEEKPLYTYSLKQGIEDGFLAPYKVVRVNLDIDINGFRPYPGMTDIYGKTLEDRIYEQKDFDRIIEIPKRTQVVAKRISDFLKETDRYAKTIVFCEDIPHAERMKTALINENNDLTVEQTDYVAQMTSEPSDVELLDDFTDPHESIPVIAVTSRLMSTGVNTQTCKLVVLDRTVNSMTEFKQIIGRGTRVREDCDKLFFTIMDFRKNYVKFAEPEFDGEPVKIKDVGEEDSFDDGDTPNNDQIPFDIPENWRWVKLGYCSTYGQAKEKATEEDIKSEKWSLDLEDIEKITGRVLQKLSANKRQINGNKICFRKGDILYSKLRPYLLKILIADEDGICTPELIPFSMIGQINPRYVLWVLRSPHVDYKINAVTYGVKMPRVGTDTMINLLIPLPPVEEQERIVKRLEELLPMCEGL